MLTANWERKLRELWGMVVEEYKKKILLIVIRHKTLLTTKETLASYIFETLKSNGWGKFNYLSSIAKDDGKSDKILFRLVLLWNEFSIWFLGKLFL